MFRDIFLSSPQSLFILTFLLFFSHATYVVLLMCCCPVLGWLQNLPQHCYQRATTPLKLRRCPWKPLCHPARGHRRKKINETETWRKRRKKRRPYVFSTAPFARWQWTLPHSCWPTTVVRSLAAAFLWPDCAAFDSLLTQFYICSGTKHKTMLQARSGDGAIKSFPRAGVKSKLAAPAESSTGLQNKTFHCEICDVHVNSETQLKQVSCWNVKWNNK